MAKDVSEMLYDISENLYTLKNTKTNLKTSIESKPDADRNLITIPQYATFDNYPTFVDEIDNKSEYVLERAIGMFIHCSQTNKSYNCSTAEQYAAAVARINQSPEITSLLGLYAYVESPMFKSYTDIYSFYFFNRDSLNSMTLNPFTFVNGKPLEIDLTNITDISLMFAGCTGLTDLPDNFDLTKLVASNYEVFVGCRNMSADMIRSIKLADIPIVQLDGTFIATNINTLKHIFFESDPTSATPGIISDSLMRLPNTFSNCISLNMDHEESTAIYEVSNSRPFSHITAAGSTFYKCTNMSLIPPLCFHNPTSLGGMFDSCTGMTHHVISSSNSAPTAPYSGLLVWVENTSDSSKTVDLAGTFRGCNSLEQLPADLSAVQPFGTSVYPISSHYKGISYARVSSFYQTFSGCRAIKEQSAVDSTSAAQVSSSVALTLMCVTSMYDAFFECRNLESITLKFAYNPFLSSGTNYVSSLTNLGRTLGRCSKLQYIYIDIDRTVTPDDPGSNPIYLNSLTDIHDLFSECSSLKVIGEASPTDNTKISDKLIIPTDKTYNIKEMFRYCNNLQQCYLFKGQTIKVSNMQYAFQGCKSLLEFPFDLDTSTCNNMRCAFADIFTFSNTLTDPTYTQGSFTNITAALNFMKNCMINSVVTGSARDVRDVFDLSKTFYIYGTHLGYTKFIDDLGKADLEAANWTY